MAIIGAGVGKTYVGTPRFRFDRFDRFDRATAWSDSAGVRQSAPPENAYKFLFCFLSQNDVPEAELVPMLSRLDPGRRAWETLGHRLADTTISRRLARDAPSCA